MLKRTSTSSAHRHTLEIIEQRRKQFEAGEDWALLDAIDWCARAALPLPLWVAQAYCERYTAWRGYRVEHLDQAFKVKRKPNKRRAKIEQLKASVALRVLKLHREGKPLDDALFRQVGAKLGVSAATVKRIYYAKDNPWPKNFAALSPDEIFLTD